MRICQEREESKVITNNLGARSRKTTTTARRDTIHNLKEQERR